MSILDRKFPFVISHTIWRRPPTRKRVRHFRGYIPGLIRLAINANRLLLDFVEDAFYEDEVVTEDKGLGHTRHFAFDVGMAQTPTGEQVPVLKGIETTRAPACVHHYVSNREETPDDGRPLSEPMQSRRAYAPENHRMDGPQLDIAPMIDQVQADLAEEQPVPRAGDIEGVDVFGQIP